MEIGHLSRQRPGVADHHLEFDLGVQPQVVGDQTRQQIIADGIAGPDAQQVSTLIRPLKQMLHGRQALQQLVSQWQQLFALGIELQTISHPIKQTTIELLFQLSQRQAGRRLGNTEPFGRFRQITGLHQRDEKLQLFEGDIHICSIKLNTLLNRLRYF